MFARAESLSDASPDASLRVVLTLELQDGSTAVAKFRPAMPLSEAGPQTDVMRVEVLGGHGPPILMGVVPDRAVRVEARSSDGSVDFARLYDLADDRLGVDAVMVEAPAAVTWVDVVALDGDGSEIAAVRVDVPRV
jgi:hypothetical protein